MSGPPPGRAGFAVVPRGAGPRGTWLGHQGVNFSVVQAEQDVLIRLLSSIWEKIKESVFFYLFSLYCLLF